MTWLSVNGVIEVRVRSYQRTKSFVLINLWKIQVLCGSCIFIQMQMKGYDIVFIGNKEGAGSWKNEYLATQVLENYLFIFFACLTKIKRTKRNCRQSAKVHEPWRVSKRSFLAFFMFFVWVAHLLCDFPQKRVFTS